MVKKALQDLWQDYQFLTKEMVKFLDRPDMNLFYDLLNQRERLQSMIDESEDNGYNASREGKDLLLQIHQDNQYIAELLQTQINQGKRIHQVTEAYSGIVNDQISRMTWMG